MNENHDDPLVSVFLTVLLKANMCHHRCYLGQVLVFYSECNKHESWDRIYKFPVCMPAQTHMHARTHTHTLKTFQRPSCSLYFFQKSQGSELYRTLWVLEECGVWNNLSPWAVLPVRIPVSKLSLCCRGDKSPCPSAVLAHHPFWKPYSFCAGALFMFPN